jgi:hypothetical protein
VPGFAHGEEGGVRHGLGVSGYAVVLCGGEVDVGGAQAGEDVFYFFKAFLRGTVLDEYLETTDEYC